MLGRAVKESPPGYLVKVDVPEKVKVRVLSKWFFFFRRGNVHKEGTAVRKHPHMGTSYALGQPERSSGVAMRDGN